jgi:sugar phosphate isomerase/epimerase
MAIEMALSTWSLRRHMGPMKQQVVTDLGETHEWTTDYPEDVSLIDFALFARSEYAISRLELTQVAFPSTEPSYLEELRKSAEAQGATIQNIPIDVGHICEPDAKLRNEHISEIKGWMDAAAAIGSLAVRVNTGPEREGSDALSLAVESYALLTEYAEGLGLDVLIENHGGLSANPDMMIKIIESVSSDRLGACPDFGNFDESVRYEALEKLMPFAKLVHAKSYAFDERGEETQIDYARCMEIIKRSGFDGPLSIEFEGDGDQYEGIRKTKELISRYL